MKIDTLSFLNLLLTSHSPAVFHSHVDALVKVGLSIMSMYITILTYCIGDVSACSSSSAVCSHQILLSMLPHELSSVIFGGDSHRHVTPLLRYHLHWLRARERISFKLCLLVYKAIHGLAPCCLNKYASQFWLFPTFLLSVLLLVVIWSYSGQGYNSATGCYVWLVRLLGTVSHLTLYINFQKRA